MELSLLPSEAGKLKEPRSGSPTTSEEKEYWPTGQLRLQEFWKNGKLEGTRKAWWENSYILCVQEFYKNGNIEGERQTWYSNGQLNIQDNYINGQREGELKWWHRNGHLLLQEFYKNGKREGSSKWWHRNGQVWIYQLYNNGRMEGEAVEYDPEDNLIKQTFWKKGMNIGKKEFYEKGLSLLDYKLDEPLAASQRWNSVPRGSPAPRELHLKELIFSYL